MLLAVQAAWGMAMWTTPSQPVRLLLDCGAGTVAQMLADGDTAPAFAHGQLPPSFLLCISVEWHRGPEVFCAAGLDGLELCWFASVSMGCGVRVRRVALENSFVALDCRWL